MYNKVDTNLNFVDREKNVEKFWKDNDIFRKSMDSRKEGETYTCADACHQGYDSALPHHEGIYGAEKGRMGHARTSCGA